MSDTLLEIDNLSVGFQLGAGMGVAIRGMSLVVRHGEAMGLVGESGSGKSLTALSIMGLLTPSARVLGGEIRFKGTNLLALSEQRLRHVRGKEISMIFQDPLASLNPAFTIGQQLIDVISTHQDVDRTTARARAIEALSMVGISSPAARFAAYPHEFSGGMRQRALIAMAIACRPQLLIADEPTTALDVTVQAQVISLLRQLRRELGLAILFITHNLDLMAELCDRAAVMYSGTIAEEASVATLFTRPRHPYTTALMRCIPRLGENPAALESIEGSPPAIGSELRGCPFEPRCSRALDVCRDRAPKEQSSGGHRVSCWAAGPLHEMIAS
jgi:peptide/nickel transport system ATP-binding protein/oligopeptide transport system ATP-binding protein